MRTTNLMHGRCCRSNRPAVGVMPIFTCAAEWRHLLSRRVGTRPGLSTGSEPTNMSWRPSQPQARLAYCVRTRYTVVWACGAWLASSTGTAAFTTCSDRRRVFFACKWGVSSEVGEGHAVIWKGGKSDLPLGWLLVVGRIDLLMKPIFVIFTRRR